MKHIDPTTITTFMPAGTPVRGFPEGTPCDTVQSSVLCQNKARELGLCGCLLAHGRTCVEKLGECRLEKHNDNTRVSEVAIRLRLRDAPCSTTIFHGETTHQHAKQVWEKWVWLAGQEQSEITSLSLWNFSKQELPVWEWKKGDPIAQEWK